MLNRAAGDPASLMSPLPLYVSTCGYGQRGRVNTVLPAATLDAAIDVGAVPFSTHCSNAASAL